MQHTFLVSERGSVTRSNFAWRNAAEYFEAHRSSDMAAAHKAALRELRTQRGSATGGGSACDPKARCQPPHGARPSRAQQRPNCHTVLHCRKPSVSSPMLRPGTAALLLFIALFFFTASLPAQTNLHVATDGTAPFKSVQAAIMSVPSGSRENPVVIHIAPRDLP